LITTTIATEEERAWERWRVALLRRLADPSHDNLQRAASAKAEFIRLFLGEVNGLGSTPEAASAARCGLKGLRVHAIVPRSSVRVELPRQGDRCGMARGINLVAKEPRPDAGREPAR